MSNARYGRTISQSQLDANHANAQHSTGPRTPEGKQIASHNALKTGLTGRTILLPSDDLAVYVAHLARLEAHWRPATDEERSLTESIAHIEWRLLRIPTLESGVLALGRKQFAESHGDESPENRAVLIEGEVFLAYGKQLANLHLQETRLTRQLLNQTTRLQALQATRRQAEERQLNEAASFYTYLQKKSISFPIKDLHKIGFEFSLAQVQTRVLRRQAREECPAWPSIQSLYLLQNQKAA